MIYSGKFLNYIDTIKNVGRFVIDKKQTFTLFNEKLTIHNEKTKPIMEFNFPTTSIYSTNHGVFSGKNFYINNLEINSFKSLEKHYFSGIFNNGIFVFAKEDVLFYDIDTNETKFHIPFFSDRSIFYFDDDKFVCRGVSIISVHSIDQKREFWSIDIKKFLGRKESSINSIYLYGNIFVIKSSCNNLLFVDFLTGAIIRKNKFDSNLFFSCSHHERRIHAFSYGTYFEIDIVTGEILRKKSLELELKARDCSPASHTVPAVNEKYIAIAPGFKPKVLLIDRETLEIVQELDLKGSYVNNSEILQFHDNRLYILDAMSFS